MKIKIIYKKRFYKPIKSLQATEDSFSILIDKKTQLISDGSFYKLPSKTNRHFYHNGFFYYEFKSNLYKMPYSKASKNNQEIKSKNNSSEVHESKNEKPESDLLFNTDKTVSKDLEKSQMSRFFVHGEIYDISFYKNYLFVSNNKILVYEKDALTIQLYGPETKINKISTYKTHILAMSYIDKNIRFFDIKCTDHKVYTLETYPRAILMISSKLFVIACEKYISFFSVGKSKPLFSYEITENQVTELLLFKNYVVCAFSNGKVKFIDYKTYQCTYEHDFDPNIKFIQASGNKLAVFSTTPDKGPWSESIKQKNILVISQIEE